MHTEKLETKRALNALLRELDQNILTAKEISHRTEEYIWTDQHFLTSYRLNCLEKILELDIDDKWILDEADIQWKNLTIQNNLLQQIRLAFLSPKGRKEKKKILGNNAKGDIDGLENLRKYVLSYLERLQ